MTTRFLINNDGTPFEPSELQTLRGTLDSLGDDERTEYRDQNASAIARHASVHLSVCELVKNRLEKARSV